MRASTAVSDGRQRRGGDRGVPEEEMPRRATKAEAPHE